MKGFIKIQDMRHTDIYLNIDYIIQFLPTSESTAGKTIITTTVGAIQTHITPEEITDMIDLSRS